MGGGGGGGTSGVKKKRKKRPKKKRMVQPRAELKPEPELEPEPEPELEPKPEPEPEWESQPEPAADPIVEVLLEYLGLLEYLPACHVHEIDLGARLRSVVSIAVPWPSKCLYTFVPNSTIRQRG